LKILFLYTELAAYNLPCFNQLIQQGNELLIYCYPVNKEAPFNFGDINLHSINRFSVNDSDILTNAKNFNPDIIFCSGWRDKGYLKVCSYFRKSKKIIVGFDNQWTGSLKQIIASWMSFYFIKPYFNYAWVPGIPQEKFAKKLGFVKGNILTGFYSADVALFNKVFNKSKYPNKRFIFSGRYYDFKGLNDLWKAFVELQNEKPNDWELWCLGTGDIIPIQHPQIKHFGFVQPINIPDIMNQTDVFILPSKFEPWGVVVHEFAAAGFPLICSNCVGAATAFLENEINGYTFKAGDVAQLKKLMSKFIDMPESELIKMGAHSHYLAQQISPQKWVDALYSVFK
jgi:glycosyltransferase involved in cell wall biosynthesis